MLHYLPHPLLGIYPNERSLQGKYTGVYIGICIPVISLGLREKFDVVNEEFGRVLNYLILELFEPYPKESFFLRNAASSSIDLMRRNGLVFFSSARVAKMAAAGSER